MRSFGNFWLLVLITVNNYKHILCFSGHAQSWIIALFHEQYLLTLVPPPWGETPFAMSPISQGWREGGSLVDSRIPLSTATWFTWSSYSPPPVPIVIVRDKPFGSLKFPHPPTPMLLPLAQVDGYWSHASQILQYRVSHCAKPTWVTQIQMMTMPWDTCRLTHQEEFLPISLKLHNG